MRPIITHLMCKNPNKSHLSHFQMHWNKMYKKLGKKICKLHVLKVHSVQNLKEFTSTNAICKSVINQFVQEYFLRKIMCMCVTSVKEWLSQFFGFDRNYFNSLVLLFAGNNETLLFFLSSLELTVPLIKYIENPWWFKRNQ